MRPNDLYDKQHVDDGVQGMLRSDGTQRGHGRTNLAANQGCRTLALAVLDLADTRRYSLRRFPPHVHRVEGRPP